MLAVSYGGWCFRGESQAGGGEKQPPALFSAAPFPEEEVEEKLEGRKAGEGKGGGEPRRHLLPPPTHTHTAPVTAILD